MVRTDSDHVDASWIEHTLHREGLIEVGSVASIDIVGQGLASRGEIERYVAHVSQGLEPMLALVEHRLPAAWPPRLRALFDGLGPQLAQRAQQPHGMALVHGDRMRWLWTRQLQRALAAYEDWH